MQIQLSEHFSFKKLLRFVLPSIVMMIFTSIYSVAEMFILRFTAAFLIKQRHNYHYV